MKVKSKLEHVNFGSIFQSLCLSYVQATALFNSAFDKRVIQLTHQLTQK